MGWEGNARIIHSSLQRQQRYNDPLQKDLSKKACLIFRGKLYLNWFDKKDKEYCSGQFFSPTCHAQNMVRVIEDKII